MKQFKKTRPSNEAEEFKIRFPDATMTNRPYSIEVREGKIIKLETDDAEIITWMKTKGFVET